MNINSTKKYIFIRDIALLSIVGNMVGWLFPFPNLVWRLLLVVLSLYVIIKEEDRFLPCEKAVLIFTAFNLLHFFICYLWESPGATQIGNILCALLPLSLFVCLAQKGVMSDKFFVVAGIVLLVAAILQYQHYERIILLSRESDNENVTNNSSVAFLMLLPMVFLFKNNIQKWATFLICLFFLITGAKRGNIFAAVIPVLLIGYSMLKDSRRSLKKATLVLSLIVGTVLLTYHWVSNNNYLMYRVEKTKEGNSSGRDVIYVGAWHVWYDSENPISYLVGYGFDGTIHQTLTGHHHAHNDWLEVLVDYGLLGVILYLAVFITFFQQIRRMQSFKWKMVFLSGVVIWFFKTFYSMGFTSETLSVAMISMGTALGRYKLEEEVL